MNRNATGCNKQIMNKKENHSAKSEIEQAFLRLMTQKSYMDITVTDIVQEANVARSFFLQKFCIDFGSTGQYCRRNSGEAEYRVSSIIRYI